MQLVLRLRGGGGITQMGIAAGGLIEQKIYTDNKPVDSYYTNSISIKINIIDTTTYCKIFNRPMPKTPISAILYIEKGFPWFERYDNELIGVKNNNKSLLNSVKSIKDFKDKFASIDECSVCLKNKLNLDFLCKHGICSECLPNIIKKITSDKDDFPCPLCRAIVKEKDVVIKSAIIEVSDEI
jgi:hypothetical protein